MMADLSLLTQKLSQYGVVVVIKDDYVFTLYMINDTQFLDENNILFKITGLVLEAIPDKQTIEVFKNEENYLLLILKPTLPDKIKNNEQTT